jgi:hypothetical protein
VAARGAGAEGAAAGGRGAQGAKGVAAGGAGAQGARALRGMELMVAWIQGRGHGSPVGEEKEKVKKILRWSFFTGLVNVHVQRTSILRHNVNF